MTDVTCYTLPEKDRVHNVFSRSFMYLADKKNFGFNTVCSSTFFHFFIDTVHEWNNLSEEIKRSGSVNSFKIKLKSIYGPKDSHKLFPY